MTRSEAEAIIFGFQKYLPILADIQSGLTANGRQYIYQCVYQKAKKSIDTLS